MEKKAKLNQSIQKSFLIIEVMSKNNKEMKLHEICKEAKIPEPTGLRILYTLEKLGYVYQNEDTLKYGLTFKFEIIAQSVRGQFDLRSIVRPYLLELSATLNEAVSLSIRNDHSLLYIDSIDSKDSIFSLAKRIGNHAPLYCTGAGKLYLASFTEEELELYLENNPLTKLTVHTLTTKNALKNELIEITKRGYSFDNEECDIGVKCVAVPILNADNKCIASISVSMSVPRITEEKLKRVTDMLIETSKNITKKYHM